MSVRDSQKLKFDLRVASVIDLRNDVRKETSENTRLEELGIRYHNVPVTLEPEAESRTTGELFMAMAAQTDFARRIVDVLEILSQPFNLPAVIHCNAGKNRTGIVTALVLGVLGVADDDIVADYMLSDSYMKAVKERLLADPAMKDALERVPGYVWLVEPDSIYLFLKTLKETYGPVRDYVRAQGAGDALFQRLEATLLTTPPGPSGSPE
jgi:protein-tyrosine phosphatase